MYTLAKLIQFFFPLMALVCLISGIKNKSIHYIISALWLSLIAVAIHFQISGNQLFGSYFNYLNTAIYTCTLFILVCSLIPVISHLSVINSRLKLICSFANASLVIGAFLVVINLWINACFIEQKMQGTPIMQVALVHKADYCHNKYIYYKVANDNTVMYLCPNYYGFIPSIGRLAISPDFITTQLPLPLKKNTPEESNI